MDWLPGADKWEEFIDHFKEEILYLTWFLGKDCFECIDLRWNFHYSEIYAHMFAIDFFPSQTSKKSYRCFRSISSKIRVSPLHCWEVRGICFQIAPLLRLLYLDMDDNLYVPRACRLRHMSNCWYLLDSDAYKVLHHHTRQTTTAYASYFWYRKFHSDFCDLAQCFTGFCLLFWQSFCFSVCSKPPKSFIVDSFDKWRACSTKY